LFDEDLLPGTTQDDDDLLGRVEVNLEGELSIDTPIQKWVTLTDLGEESVQPHDFQTSAHSLCLLQAETRLACLLAFIVTCPICRIQLNSTQFIFELRPTACLWVHPGAPPSGAKGSEAQIELDISFYGAEDRKKRREGKLRGRVYGTGLLFFI